MKINFNDLIWFKLTPHGEQLWREYFSSTSGTYMPKPNEHGWLVEQLWEVAKALQSELFNGARPVLVDNVFYTSDPEGSP